MESASHSKKKKKHYRNSHSANASTAGSAPAQNATSGTPSASAVTTVAKSPNSSSPATKSYTLSLNPTERLQQELKHLLASAESNGLEIEVDDDNFYKWRVKMFNFDEETKLAKDLIKYSKLRDGRDHVLVEVLFPKSYPLDPPYMRVVYPRFIQYTAHVTIGGSICVEDLTRTGWKKENEMEPFLIMIRHLLVEGKAEIDFRLAKQDYTEAEAKQAFIRVAQFHGWQT